MRSTTIRGGLSSPILRPVKGILAAWLLVVALAGYANPARAAGPAVLAFAPVNSSTPAGDTVSVDVTVANVAADPGLAEYDLTLHVNPAVVRIDSFSDSGFITTGQTIVVCVPGAVDNTAGTAAATCTAVPLFGLPGETTTSAVTLLHAAFTALAPGTSPLTLFGTLSGPTGTDIPAAIGSGSISVSAPAAAPSATSTPSATPTQTASPTTPVQTSTAMPTPRVPAATNTPEPASATVAARLKAPETGSGGSGGGPSWAVLAGAFVVCSGVVVVVSYAVWQRRRAQIRT